MRNTTPKLMTRGKFAGLILAAAVGASLSPVREYRATGGVQTQTVVFALIAFGVCFVIALAVGWWANRPESGDRDG